MLSIKTTITFFLLFCSAYTFAQKAEVSFLPNLPYDKYELKTEQDTITFYLSVTSSKENLPLMVYIQGSGMNSLFSEQNERILPTSGHFSWYSAGREKCRTLIIEKPGVQFLQTGPSTDFDNRFSLESWSNRIVKTINYVVKNEKINPDSILVAGHSEGGIVAARVANLMKDKVANVAILAGEGPSQLYSLYKFAEDGTFFNTKEHNMPTAEQRISYLENAWKAILADPESTQKKFWGLTYLRWSSMLKTSVMEELSGYNGKILLIQGTDDKNVHPETATIAYTYLLSKGKNVQLNIVQHADHSFNITNDPKTDGWKMTIEQILEWFSKS